MEPVYRPKFQTLSYSQWIFWGFVGLFFIFLFWGSYSVYRFYTPFVTELTLTGTYTDTVISRDQYYYSGLLKFYGTANPLQVSLGTLLSYFPSGTGTLQKENSYTVVLQNTTNIPVYICYNSTIYNISDTLTQTNLTGNIYYITLGAKQMIPLRMAYMTSTTALLF